MNIKINFKHLDHTEALDSMIRKKSSKLEKFLPADFDVSWTCMVQGGEHHSELHVSAQGHTYHAKGSNDDLYKTFDDVLEKVETQIKKRKEQDKDHIHQKHKV
ncbi:MAG: ribosome-associated translation inhibitor RaiA [Bacteriovoracaceae bacterium]|nr:ribosome-associated translation inhibitor RaiA [Bacteriovoracaceae bacterium]